jgi:LacI family transcriptional regulator
LTAIIIGIEFADVKFLGVVKLGRIKKVTLDDIAKEVGVSRFLVCRALTGKPGVNEETRQRIQQVAASIGYKGRKTKTQNLEIMSVAVLIDEAEVNRVFWTRIISGIEATARDKNYDLLLRAVSSDEVERGEVPSMILEGRVNGVIITGNFAADYVARFEKLDCPVILVDNYFSATSRDAVLIADWEGSNLITKHLIDLGHKKIGYAGQISGHWSWLQRYYGFIAALHENGLHYDNRYALAQDIDTNIWRTEYMDQEVSLIKEMPTAWFCNNDKTAHFLIQALNKRGLRVPDDVSVTGFDYLPEEYPEIPSALTTVKVFGREMGKAAFEQLLWRLNNPAPHPRRILIGVQFEEGITTGPPKVKK